MKEMIIPLVAMGVAALLVFGPKPGEQTVLPTVGPTITRVPTSEPTAEPTSEPTPQPTAPTVTLAPVPSDLIPIETIPISEFSEETGPIGCPVRPTMGKVMMSQGYGVGTHAPAEIWGAVDLVVDTNGDDLFSAEETFGQPVVSTHTGKVVDVVLGNPDTGNRVRIQTGTWTTDYSHLDQVHVSIGQEVTAGDQIGTIGNTGRLSDGPHLDYQVRHGGINIDPTIMIGCF
jgi:murein DD-endopeptidase MepM/ murein hydrolase activator NlpD